MSPLQIFMSPARDKPAVDPSTTLSVAEATSRLGVGRARVYQLIEAGALDTGGTEPVRITLDSVERRRNMSPTVGAPLASLSAWAVLALGSGDAAFLKHVAGLLSDPDRSRARSRLHQQSLRALLPRLRNRAAERRFLVGAEPLLELLADPRVVLGGASAARVLSWELTEGSWAVEAYVGRDPPDRTHREIRARTGRPIRRPGAAQRAGAVAVSAAGPSGAGRGRRARSGRSRRRPAG